MTKRIKGFFNIKGYIADKAGEIILDERIWDRAVPEFASIKRFLAKTNETDREGMTHIWQQNSLDWWCDQHIKEWDLRTWEEIGASYGVSGRQAQRDNPPHDYWNGSVWSCTSSMDHWLANR